MGGWWHIGVTALFAGVGLLLAILAVRRFSGARTKAKELVSMSLGGASAVDSGAFRVPQPPRTEPPRSERSEQEASA